MEWLLNHPDDDGQEDETDVVEETPADQVPRPELTAEEKEQKLKELEERRAIKRKEREEREKEEATERERRRVEDGKALSKLKQDLNDQEIKKLADERRREKQETADAKRRVLEQIEADKRARQMERDAAKGKISDAPTPQPPAAAPVPKRNYDETKIQIRLQDGQKLEQTFKSKESLSAVRVFIQMNRSSGESSPIKLMTSFPRKVFVEEDYEKPLEALGLCPSAVLILSK